MKPFLILFCSHIIVAVSFSNFIDFDSLVISSSEEGLSSFLENEHMKINWVQKTIVPSIFTIINIFIKTTAISSVIYTGLFFVTSLEETKTMGITFRSVCIAELIFVIEKAINLVVFIAKPDLTFEFIQHFSPVSLYGLLGQEIGIDYLNYFLKSINLYEIAYILVLAYLISDNLDLGFSKSLKTTFFSYGSLMACWVVFVTYLILNTGP